MRVISYRHNGTPGVGVMVDDTGFVALSTVAPELPGDLRGILEIDPNLDRVRAAAEGKPCCARCSIATESTRP